MFTLLPIQDMNCAIIHSLVSSALIHFLKQATKPAFIRLYSDTLAVFCCKIGKASVGHSNVFIKNNPDITQTLTHGPLPRGDSKRELIQLKNVINLCTKAGILPESKGFPDILWPGSVLGGRSRQWTISHQCCGRSMNPCTWFRQQ